MASGADNRFEKSYHHRNHIYIPSRLDKDQTHGRKGGKSGGNTGRLSTPKATITTEIHEKPPKHSVTSPSKHQNAAARSRSASSDKNQLQQQITKARSKTPPSQSDPPVEPSSMLSTI